MACIYKLLKIFVFSIFMSLVFIQCQDIVDPSYGTTEVGNVSRPKPVISVSSIQSSQVEIFIPEVLIDPDKESETTIQLAFQNKIVTEEIESSIFYMPELEGYLLVATTKNVQTKDAEEKFYYIDNKIHYLYPGIKISIFLDDFDGTDVFVATITDEFASIADQLGDQNTEDYFTIPEIEVPIENIDLDAVLGDDFDDSSENKDDVFPADIIPDTDQMAYIGHADSPIASVTSVMPKQNTDAQDLENDLIHSQEFKKQYLERRLNDSQ